MRRRFELCVYAYVVMPEHVHLLLSEPEAAILAEALHFLKLSFTKRRVTTNGRVWKLLQKRTRPQCRDPMSSWKNGLYHRNPVKRGLVASQNNGSGAVIVTTLAEPTWWRLSQSGQRAIARKFVGGPESNFLNPG